MMTSRMPTWLWKRVVPCAVLVGLSCLVAFGSLSPVSRHSALAATAFRRTLNNLVHVPAYGLLTLAWTWNLWAVAGLRPTWAAPLGAGAAFVFGVAMELGQLSVPNRTASVSDALLNATGAVLALGALVLLAVWRARRAQLPSGAGSR